MIISIKTAVIIEKTGSLIDWTVNINDANRPKVTIEN